MFLKKVAYITAQLNQNKTYLIFEMPVSHQDEDEVLDAIEHKDAILKEFKKNNFNVVDTGARSDANTVKVLTDKDKAEEVKKKMGEIAKKNLIEYHITEVSKPN
jgi:tRNA nucleotidyltransferase (CCA-adding enzyme)